MWLFACLFGFFIAFAQALTLPVHNSMISFDTHEGYDKDNRSTFSYPLSTNLTSGRPSPDPLWEVIYKLGGSRLCITAVMVNFGYALADIAAVASDVPVRSESWTVDNYREVNLRLIVFNESFDRLLALNLLYHSVENMRQMRMWRNGQWTMFQGGIAIARLDVNDGSLNQGIRNKGMCDPRSASTATSKRSVLGSSVSIINIHEKIENVSLVTTTSLSAGSNDKDDNSVLKLTYSWSGENLGYLTALMSPLYLIANEPLRNPDPYRTAWSEHQVTVRAWDVTFRFSAYDTHKPTPQVWTYYWIIKALGQLPLAYADKWDFREISATVSLDDVPVGVVRIFKGILQ